MMRIIDLLRKYLKPFSILLAFTFVIYCSVNYYIRKSTSDQVYLKTNKTYEKKYVAMVLGAKVGKTRPGTFLIDRLEKVIELYQKGIITRILVSGDHGTVDYDEVNVMKNFLMNRGVPSRDIFWIMQVLTPLILWSEQKKYLKLMKCM